MAISEEELRDKAQKIKFLLMDVDGVMTNGKITFAQGEEVKFFDTKDGVGLVLARMNGLKLGLITGRTSVSVTMRAESLKMDEVHQGVVDKKSVLSNIMKRHNVEKNQICFMGDDLIDLPALEVSGLSVAVSDAVPEVRDHVDYVTARPGGEGAVREVVELILKAQGKWPDAIKKYLNRSS